MKPGRLLAINLVLGGLVYLFLQMPFSRSTFQVIGVLLWILVGAIIVTWYFWRRKGRGNHSEVPKSRERERIENS